MSDYDILDFPNGQRRITAAPFAHRQLSATELRFVGQDLIAYQQGHGFGKVPGGPDIWLQLVQVAAIESSVVPSEAVPIASRMIHNRAADGDLRALRALAVLEGRGDDVAAIDARPLTIDFNGNRPIADIEAMLLEFADGQRMLVNLNFYELSELIVNGKRDGVSDRAISIARARLRGAAERGSSTAAQLLAIVDPVAAAA